MDMKKYLTEIEHAARSTFDLVWAEHEKVAAAEVDVASLTAATEADYRRAEALMQFDDPDDFMMGVGIHWETYFGPDKKRYSAIDALAELRAIRDARAFSRAAQAANIIQYAKQGISIVHRDWSAAPSGRNISGQPLAKLIWMARNQGLHWEDHTFNENVTRCFEELKAFDPIFGDYASRNIAFEVISAIGWRDYAAFEADMLSLA